MAVLCAILLIFSKVYGELERRGVQSDTLVRAQLGDDVTLPCFHPTEGFPTISWLKQPLGQMPQLVAVKKSTSATFFDEFENSEHFSVEVDTETFNLTVSHVGPPDTATYYCASTRFNGIKFVNGITLIVMDPESHSRTVVVQLPESESVQPGGSVTLQCTVHTETCAGEHSVYWFRQGSGESPPGIIYTHGDRSDECQRSSGAVSPTQSCVYNLPKRNLSPSDAGTYYCAVATCGEVLFGNGTKLDFKETKNEALPLYCLAGALVLSVILNIALMLKRRKGSVNSSAGVTTGDQISRGDMSRENYACSEETMNYAALNITAKRPKERRNKREAQRETIYSEMRFQDQE